MRMRSIAPGAARWPQEIWAPSKAGPVGDEAGEQALAVAEHDLGVGAHVDDEPELVAEIGRLGEHDAGSVGADVAGDAGQRIDERSRRDVEPEIPRPRLMGAVDRQRERARRRSRSGRGRGRDDA